MIYHHCRAQAPGAPSLHEGGGGGLYAPQTLQGGGGYTLPRPCSTIDYTLSANLSSYSKFFFMNCYSLFTQRVKPDTLRIAKEVGLISITFYQTLPLCVYCPMCGLCGLPVCGMRSLSVHVLPSPNVSVG